MSTQLPRDSCFLIIFIGRLVVQRDFHFEDGSREKSH